MIDFRSNILILTLSIATACFIAGQVGLLLAVPPGNVALFWPPAGITLGVLLIYGKRSVPGIFLGAFLTEFIFPEITSNVSAVILSASISTGALLQALWGYWLLQKFSAHETLFIKPQATRKFLLLVPVISLCSSTLGTSVLMISGLLDISFPLTWLSWWVGDALGLATFTPLVFGILRRRDIEHRSSLIMLALTMTLVAVLTLVASIYLSYRSYIDTAQTHMLELAQVQSSIIESAIQSENLDFQDIVIDQDATILRQMNIAFNLFESTGQTSEYLLGKNSQGFIEYILSKNIPLETLPVNLPINGELAEPMSRALSGETGTMIGMDHNGEQVLAGYVYSPVLDTGMVVYSSLHEIREPFVRNTQIVVLITLMLVVLGIVSFQRISTPITKTLEAKSRELKKLVDEQTRDLLESQEEFRQLFESAPDAIIIANEDGVIRMINDQVTRLTGYQDDDLVGQSIEQLLPFSNRRAHLQHRIKYMQAPTARQMGTGRTLFCQRKDGSIFSAEIALSPIRTERELLIAASMRDATEREMYQEKLRQNEERLEQAFRAANMEAWELNLNTGRMQSSWYLYKRFGFETENIKQGKDPWQDIMLSADRARVQNSFKYFVLGKSLSYKETFRVRDVNGSVHWVQSIAKPTEYDQNGEITALIGIRIDVTDQIEADAALKSKMDELEEFNVLARGRELRMIELKKEINKLLRQLGNEKKYEVPD